MKILPSLLISLLLITACNQNQSIGQVVLSPTDYKTKLEAAANKQIVDVRTPQEYKGGFIGDAKNINIYDKDFKAQISKLDKNKPVFVYCKAGGRSADAAQQFISLGFKEVYDLKGGMMSWEAQKMPVNQEGDAKPESKPQGMLMPDYDLLVKEASVVLVDFYAPWCAPCKKMAPALDSLKSVYANQSVKIVKINVDENDALVQHFKLDNIPVIKVYKAGALVEEKQGFVASEQLAGLISKHL